jgi:hypothetical protein
MSDEIKLGLEQYAELESEAEPPPEERDYRPVSCTSSDWTISTLRDKYERGQIDLQPHYQREYVWELKPELPSRLIESLLLEIPIPPIYFGKLAGGKLEVIDGQQRLTTLIKFVRNDYPLQKLLRLGSLNDKFFRDLAEENQAKILDATIRSVVIDAGSNGDLRYEVFERLNRGSMALNEQELRNCAYRGSFCDLLADLERDSYWRKVKGSDMPEPRFVEREMILRFFAFADRMEHYTGNLKNFLNTYMEKYGPKTPDQLAPYTTMFHQTMQNLYTVFGPNAGRLYSTGSEDHPTIDGKWEAAFSISAFDIQASALIGYPTAKVQAAAEQIREAYIFYLLTNPQIRIAISRRPAQKSATRMRWYGFKEQVQQILNGVSSEPRFFPYELRRELFNANPICAICKNEIHSFEDCTVDHIQPLTRNGKTRRENAQLTHRSCTARKYANIYDHYDGDDPLGEAQILFSVGHITAAGAIAGVALERHLKTLCKEHNPPLQFGPKDTIVKLNEMLRQADVYELVQWRTIALLADIRNRCDHADMEMPRKEDVEDLIKKVRQFIAAYPA